MGGKETVGQACRQPRRQAGRHRQTDIVGGTETARQACGQLRRQADTARQADRVGGKKLLGRQAGGQKGAGLQTGRVTNSKYLVS